MYLPRELFSHRYNQMVRYHGPLSPPVLLLVSSDVDSLCACRILTSLLRRDYVHHKVQPINSYSELAKAGAELIQPMRTTQGGSGGLVVCLGVGGLIDLEGWLGLDPNDDGTEGMCGVEIWLFESRRPYNLTNVFGATPFVSRIRDGLDNSLIRGVDRGKITRSFQFGSGGIVVFDDGDIDTRMELEREAYCVLSDLPPLDNDSSEEDSDADVSPLVHGQTEFDVSGVDDLPIDIPPSNQNSKKRKHSTCSDDSELEDPTLVFCQRAKRQSKPLVSSLFTSTRLESFDNGCSTDIQTVTSTRNPRLPRQNLSRLIDTHNRVLEDYYSSGASYAEPISSLLYSLASDLGREDNDLLWYAIIGSSTLDYSYPTLPGRCVSPDGTSETPTFRTGDRGSRLRALLRDEVRRLNPPTSSDLLANEQIVTLITQSRSPTDAAIRLSPEPKLLMLRHWSLYESMLHSPYLASKLQLWTESGQKKLHKFLAKMGIGLSQCKQSYTHMDIELKKTLRERLLKFAPMYGLQDLIPSFGSGLTDDYSGWGFVRCWGWRACLTATDVAITVSSILDIGDCAVGESPVVTGASAELSSPANLTTKFSANGPAFRPGDLACNSENYDFRDSSPLGDRSAHSQQLARTVDHRRFFLAYDALAVSNVAMLTAHIPVAQELSRAIFRTGKLLIEKRQIKRLRAFRMAVVKDGPDAKLFSRTGPLVKLAGWLVRAIREMDGQNAGELSEAKKSCAGTDALVLAGLDEERNTFVVVGLASTRAIVRSSLRTGANPAQVAVLAHLRRHKGRAKASDCYSNASGSIRAPGGSDREFDSGSDSGAETDLDFAEESTGGPRADDGGRNRFGLAFVEVADETGARIQRDSFEHCVVEVPKHSLSYFLERLSMKAIVN